MEQMDELFDDAVAWLAGAPQTVGPKTYKRAVDWLMLEHPEAGLVACKRATSLAMVACGVMPIDGFKIPYLIDYSQGIDVGDTITGGRTIYDEYGKVEGVVERIKDGMVDLANDDWCAVSSIYKVVWRADYLNKPAGRAMRDRLTLLKANHDRDDMLYVGPDLTQGDAHCLINSWINRGG
jgi:hypothetical protein